MRKERDEAGRYDGGVGGPHRIKSEAKVWIPTPPLLIATTLRRSLNFSEPTLPLMEMGIKVILIRMLKGRMRIK